MEPGREVAAKPEPTLAGVGFGVSGVMGAGDLAGVIGGRDRAPMPRVAEVGTTEHAAADDWRGRRDRRLRVQIVSARKTTRYAANSARDVGAGVTATAGAGAENAGLGGVGGGHAAPTVCFVSHSCTLAGR